MQTPEHSGLFTSHKPSLHIMVSPHLCSNSSKPHSAAAYICACAAKSASGKDMIAGARAWTEGVQQAKGGQMLRNM